MKTNVYFFFQEDSFVFDSFEKAKEYKEYHVDLFERSEVKMFAVDFDGSELCVLKNSKEYSKYVDICTVPLWWADIHLADGSRDFAYIYEYGGAYAKSSKNNSGAAYLVTVK